MRGLDGWQNANERREVAGGAAGAARDDRGVGQAPRNQYRDRIASRIRRYAPADEERLFAFRSSTFSGEDVQRDREYFRWQTNGNPQGRPDEPPLWVYESDGRIVAQQGGIPVSIKIGEREYHASWACDLMVEPAHRFRGIGALLAERHHQENDLTLGLSISEPAHRAYLAAGWLDLGTLPLFFRPLDISLIVASRAKGPIPSVLGAIANLPLRLGDGLGLRGGTQLVPVARFDSGVDALWERVSPQFPVICRRDSSYLNWRYADYPRPGRYGLYRYTSQGRLQGWAVLRMSLRRRVPTGHVVDYLCPPEATRPLFAACLEALRRAGAALVYCRHQSPYAAAALRWLGFVRRDSGCLLMAKNGQLPDLDFRLLRDPTARFFTSGDSDADYLRGDS